MVQFPVRVPRRAYRGSKPSLLAKLQERNRIAQLCEDYINVQVGESRDNVVQLLYGVIAHVLCQDERFVREILVGVDGGHNGLTVLKRLPSGTP
jgi:hypothetical protein